MNAIMMYSFMTLNDRASHSRYFSDELEACNFFVKKRTYVYRIRYLWYNLFIAQNKNLNEKLNSGFGPNARVNSI